MMKKTGAGLLWSRAALILFGVYWVSGGTGALGQEDTTASPPISSFSDANDKAEARLESVKGKTLDELQALLKATNESLPALGKAASERNNELQQARNVADREAPEIRALYKQIEDLQGKIAAVTDTLPGVREKLEIYNAAQSSLFEEVQFRTKLMGLIDAKEAAKSASKEGTETP